MAKTKQLVTCIKLELHAKGITYKDLSNHLKITESAVKHMFSRGNFSLERLDSIAEILDVDMSDLVALAVDREPKLERLAFEQEEELVRDMKLFVVAYTVINYWSFDEILDHYAFTEPELVGYLVRLEKMGFLDLRTNNRIKPKVATNFRWNAEGPIERLFQTQFLPEFFKDNFTKNDSQRVVKSGEITEHSRSLLAKRVKALGDFFDDLCFQDRNEKLGISRTGSSLVVGVKEWSFSPFFRYQKLNQE